MSVITLTFAASNESTKGQCRGQDGAKGLSKIASKSMYGSQKQRSGAEGRAAICRCFGIP